MNEVLTDGSGTGLLEPATLGRLRAVREETDRRPLVLVVEDNPDDRDFIGWAFEECDEPVDLHWSESGEEALDWLSRGEPRRRPALILLDLDLPGRGGLATLDAVRRDLSLRPIPVIIFTGSGEDDDIKRCYEKGANSYFTKPDTMEGYRNIIRTLESYWLRGAELPPR